VVQQQDTVHKTDQHTEVQRVEQQLVMALRTDRHIEIQRAQRQEEEQVVIPNQEVTLVHHTTVPAQDALLIPEVPALGHLAIAR
jgi:hypothetical protein